MAQVLSAGSFTLGPNNSVAIFDNSGEVDWGLISTINWTSKPVIVRKEVSLMRGQFFNLAFNHGWQGEMTIQRFEGKFDNYWYLNAEAAVQQGAPYPTFTIVQTIKETDGTVSRYTFIGSTITYEDAGKFSNEEGVVQQLTFTAPQRIVSIT